MEGKKEEIKKREREKNGQNCFGKLETKQFVKFL